LARPDLHSFPTRRSSDLSEKLADLGGAADGGADSAVRPTPTTTPDVPDADVPTSPTTPAPTIPDEAGTGSGPTLVDSEPASGAVDRKSTRLNSSHVKISY